MDRLKKTLVFLVVFALCFCISAAFAANKKKDERMDDRILGGHLFLHPFEYPLAMPTTNVGVGLGYAYLTSVFDESLDLIFLEEDTFNSAGLAEQINFEIAFMQRFSFELALQGRALVGADEETAMLYGGQGFYNAKLVPKVMLWQSNKTGTCISLAADLMIDQGVQSSPAVLFARLLQNVAEMIEEIEQSQTLPDEDDFTDLVKLKLKDSIITQRTTSVVPSLLIAQTLHPTFGLQAGIRYDLGIDETIEAPDEFEMDAGDPPSALMLGMTGTFDFNPISRLHMGIKAGVDYSMEKDDSDEYDTLSLGGGVMYTGRKDLELGATIYREATDSEDVSETAYILYLNMRYFF